MSIKKNVNEPVFATLASADMVGIRTATGQLGYSDVASLQTLDSYTVANAPAAASYPRRIIYVSNGNAGVPCIAVSNGTSWLRIALGTAISAT